MVIIKILLIILVALLVSVLFHHVFKISGPWGNFWILLLLLTLAGLAAEAWLPPVGPIAYDIAWFPTLFVILIFALVLAVASPSARRDVRKPRGHQVRSSTNTSSDAALGITFWLLLLFLMIAVIWGLLA